jgi:[ribosomal protein S18]-alanine N-acetyltransferase
MNIRPMRWWDIEPAAALEVELFEFDAWSVEQFWGELAQPTRRYLVAEDDGVICGYAGLFVLPPDADVQTIAVAPDRQGTGLGGILLRALFDQARDCGSVLLEVRSDNAAAIALYRRFGFEVISRRSNYYAPNVDALVMRVRPVPHA